MSYSVAQRTSEIGVRVALGAQTMDVLKLVMGQGLALTLIGTGLGMAGAFALTHLMTTMLYGVSATDPWMFTSVSILPVVIAMLACYLPERRATQVDPIVALRHD